MYTPTSNFSRALTSGLVGAVALNILHETVRQFVPTAPRADLLGERSLVKGFKAVGEEPPTGKRLYGAAMVGDVASNAGYYSLVGLAGKTPLLAGTALGVLAGIGAVTLPGPMGLGQAPTARTPATVAMTIGWYLLGGIISGAVYRKLRK
jgi:hypothetical protein